MEGVEEEVHSGASVGVVEWWSGGELWSIMWLGCGGGVVEEWLGCGGGVVRVEECRSGIIAGERGGWFFDGSKIMSNNFDPI